MRIISSFKDYYDGVQRIGQSDVLFLREKKILHEEDHRVKEFKTNNSVKNHFYHPWEFSESDVNLFCNIYENFYPIGNGKSTEKRVSFTISTNIVFIGKEPFPLIIVKQEGPFKNKEAEPKFIFSLKDLQESGLQNIEKDGMTGLPAKKIFQYLDHFIQRKNFISTFDSPITLVETVFRKGLRVTENPCLAEYEFFRAVDSYSIFQMIEQLFNSYLVKNEKISPINDKDKIVKHGFDLIESFRKRKESEKI